MIIDATKEISYVTVIPPQSIASNTNSAAIDLQPTGSTQSGFIGRIAAIVSTGVATGTTPVLAGYFQSGADTNQSNAANVTDPLTGTPAAITATNNTNQVQVVGIDARGCKRYLWFVPVVTGTNAPNIPFSLILAGQKRVENT